MLVIRRRQGEGFCIGDTIEVDILEIDGNQVKIGIRAPREVSILRKEIATTREANLASAHRVEETVEAEAMAAALERLRFTSSAIASPLAAIAPALTPKKETE